MKKDQLRQIEEVSITILVDNEVDLLLPNAEDIIRPPKAEGSAIPRETFIAEHGLSLMVMTRVDGERHDILLDAGYGSGTLLHNASLLNVDIASLETVVISHGHMDHVGALRPLVEAHGGPLTIVAHPDAFHTPRYATTPHGGRFLFPPPPPPEELEALGARVIREVEPSLVAGDTVLVTGQIPRKTSFEEGLTQTVLERDGALVPDRIADDQGIVLNLQGRGLVVISGCAHAGIINTVLYARELSGVERVAAVLGGFHLPGAVDSPAVRGTVEALEELAPDVLVPMHCTGWTSSNLIADTLPNAFRKSSVGTTFVLRA